MKRAGRFSLITVAVMAAAALLFWSAHVLWNSSANSPIVDMPEEEFANNRSLTMPEEPISLDTPLTAEGYLALLSELSEPESLLWDGSITVFEGDSSRSFTAVYRKEGKTLSRSCSNTASYGGA